MIRINRGIEPSSLPAIRAAKLAILNALNRPPTSDDVTGYRVVAEDLWKMQYHKCCYCEKRILKCFNDVEHYRPKCRADRLPGCTLTRGYWWLAFTWNNLLFACPSCNRSAKNDRFPLNVGSVSLCVGETEPGQELPLLLNPGDPINPVEHIVFIEKSIGPPGSPKYWWARPRNGSIYGNMTIDICELNSLELREVRNDHFHCIIKPQIDALIKALSDQDPIAVQREYDRGLEFLKPRNEYVGLTYDILCSYIPNSRIQFLIGSGWPVPSQVAP